MMKKFISAVLIVALMSPGLSAAAETSTTSGSNDTVSVSLNTIEQIWTKSSPDLTKINNDLEVSKTTYDYLKYTNDIISSNVLIDSTGFLSYEKATIQNSLGQAKIAYDIANTQYNAKIQNAILSAKQTFIACWQDELNISVSQASLSQKQKQLLNYSDGLSKGYISQKNYADLKNSVDNLQNTVNSLNTKLIADEDTLKMKLGLDLNTNPKFTYPNLNEDVMGGLMTMDQAADLKTLLTNSVNIKVLEITYNDMNSYSVSSTSAQFIAAYQNIATARTNTETSFTISYNNLLNQYSDLKNSYQNLAEEKDTLDKTQQKYSRGFVSALALSNINLEYTSMEAALKVKESSVYSTFLSYMNMVAGN